MKTTNLPFRNRIAAGRALADHLKTSHGWCNPLVIGLPRGGVVVAAEVADALNADLEVLVVLRLGLPWQPEVAMGAIASGGICIRNGPILRASGASEDDFMEVAHRERQELKRREKRYRGDRPLPSMAGRAVILVDDGLATGATMRAAIAAVRAFHPEEIVVALPVGAAESVDELRAVAEEVVCLATPESFETIRDFYEDFSQTGDEEVEAILEGTFSRTRATAGSGATGNEM